MGDRDGIEEDRQWIFGAFYEKEHIVVSKMPITLTLPDCT